MTIGKRLILILAVATAALLGVGGVGLFSLGRIASDFGVVQMNTVPSVQAMTEIGVAYRDMRTFLLSHIMESDPDLKKAFGERINETRALADKTLNRYAQLVASDEDKANFEALKKAFAAYRAAYDDTVTKSATGQSDLAIESLYMKVLPTSQDVEKALQKATLYNLKLQDEAFAHATDTVSRSRIFVVGGVAVALVILGAFGFFLYRAITVPLATMQRTVRRINRELDFTLRVPVESHDEVGKTVQAFNALIEGLQGSLKEISDAVGGVSGRASQMADTSRSLSDNAEAASEASANIAATVEELTVSINHVADRAAETNQLSHKSGELAQRGSEVIGGTVAEINGIAGAIHDAAKHIDTLERESSNVGAVVNVIKEVADQTNLLALNAAIEAARAGEQGRGFAVVADEVRKLAERTAISTQEIGKLISGMQQGAQLANKCMREVVERVEGGVKKAQEAGAAIAEISAGSTQVVEMVGDISHAIREQSTASLTFSKEVELIAQTAEQSSTMAGETADAAEQLRSLAQQMQAVVERYRV